MKSAAINFCLNDPNPLCNGIPTWACIEMETNNLPLNPEGQVDDFRGCAGPIERVRPRHRFSINDRCRQIPWKYRSTGSQPPTNFYFAVDAFHDLRTVNFDTRLTPNFPRYPRRETRQRFPGFLPAGHSTNEYTKYEKRSLPTENFCPTDKRKTRRSSGAVTDKNDETFISVRTRNLKRGFVKVEVVGELLRNYSNSKFPRCLNASTSDEKVLRSCCFKMTKLVSRNYRY